MKNTYNIILVGVGGQGILTLGRILGIAAIKADLDAAIAEVHGMSQRGGSVIVNVKIGKEPSPLIPVGGADLMIALELIEAARYTPYLKKDGIAVVNDFIWPPPLAKYPSREEIVKALSSKIRNLYIYDAATVSRDVTGSIISSNIALLGFAVGVSKNLRELIGLRDIESALEEVFTGRVLEVNREVLRRSYSDGVEIAEKRGDSE